MFLRFFEYRDPHPQFAVSDKINGSVTERDPWFYPGIIFLPSDA